MKVPDELLELVEKAEGAMAQGDTKFNGSDYSAASLWYKHGCTLVDRALKKGVLSGADKTAVQKLKDACHPNLAYCHLKLEELVTTAEDLVAIAEELVAQLKALAPTERKVKAAQLKLAALASTEPEMYDYLKLRRVKAAICLQSWCRMGLAKIVAKNEGRKEREQALYAYVKVKHARKIQAAFRRRLSATAVGGELAGSASEYVATEPADAMEAAPVAKESPPVALEPVAEENMMTAEKMVEAAPEAKVEDRTPEVAAESKAGAEAPKKVLAGCWL